MPEVPARPSPPLAPVVSANITALLERRHREDRRKPRQMIVAEAITRFTGSMRFVCLHVAICGVWFAWNGPWARWPRFDPSFVMLAMFASVESIFLSTFILITQNRMAALNDQRADLDLQISLLAEHEITRLIKLVSAMAVKMGIEGSADPALEPLKQDVKPDAVLDELSKPFTPRPTAGGD